MSHGPDIEHLLLRRLQGLCSEEDNRRIAEWASKAPENRAVLERLDSEGTLREDLGTLFQLVDGSEGEGRLERMKAHIQQTVDTGGHGKIHRARWFTWRRYAAAAAVLIIAAAWGYYYQTRIVPQPAQYGLHANDDVQPGGNRATLTLADGRTIHLSEAQAGIVVGDEIRYADGSDLTQGDSTPARIVNLKSKIVNELVLTTPKGGTYQITLPDGTNVWLNAASTLKYPSRFDSKERVVELEGEAYFEVSHQLSADNVGTKPKADSRQPTAKRLPFRVISGGQTVEVLGTQFNIAAYPDEPTVKTTLVEGSVQIALTTDHPSPITLKPGEQASTHGAAIDIKMVDTDRYTAWKDGRFYFRRTPLEDIMRQISRWYDVEVVYQRGVPKETFSGKVSRNVSLMGLLGILQVSAINIQLEGNKLIVN